MNKANRNEIRSFKGSWKKINCKIGKILEFKHISWRCYILLVLIAPHIQAAGVKLGNSMSQNNNDPFVFVYFNTGDEGEQLGLQLAGSRDGYCWRRFEPPEDCFLKPKVGGGLFRDPSVILGPDGVFHMVWTTGWWRQGIGIAHSSDLIHWSSQEYIDVMTNISDWVNCWAPEITYDPVSKTYLIYWASTVPGLFPKSESAGEVFQLEDGRKIPVTHRIFMTTTKDFETYAPAQLFFDEGYNCIDAFMIRDDHRNRWVMLIKDEDLYPTPKKNLRVTFSDSPCGPWCASSGPISTDWVEGPSLLKVGGEWLLYYDAYKRGRYEGMKTKNFETWIEITDQLKMPEGLRHGTPIPVDESVFQKLLELENKTDDEPAIGSPIAM